MFPIKFLDYYDEIWFDTISMDVGHVILGRPCIMSPNEFEKKVKDQPILSGLAKKEISRNS